MNERKIKAYKKLKHMNNVAFTGSRLPLGSYAIARSMFFPPSRQHTIS